MKTVITIIISFLLISCEEDNTTSTNGKSITFNIDHNYNGDEILLSESEHTNTAGNTFQISQLKYFVSNIKLTKANDEQIELDEVFFIDLSLGQTSFEVDVEEGIYKNLSFYIGVDSVKNHSNPATYDADNALNPSNTDMHWNWMKGYIFSSLEGYLIDDGETTNGFSYHIGNMENLMEIVLVPSNNIDLTTDNSINLDYNLANIFSGTNEINIEDRLVTHSSGDEGLSNKLSENITNALSIK